MAVDNGNEKATGTDNSLQSSFNLIFLVWQYKWLVLLGVTVGVAGGSVVYSRSQPIYRSNAQLLVIKKRSDVVPVSGSVITESYLDDYVSTHIVLLKSPVVLGDAVQSGGLALLKSFEGQGNVAGAIASNLIVTRDNSGTNRTIINLAYEGPVSSDTPKILDAVIGSYTRFLEGAYRNVSLETEQLYFKARDILKKDIAEREDKYKKFRESSPVLWKTKDGANVHQARIAEIEMRKSALVIRKAEIQGKLKAVLEAKQAGTLESEFMLSSSDTGSTNATKGVKKVNEEILATLIVEEQELLEDYGESHPRVRSVKSKIARIKKIIEQDSDASKIGLMGNDSLSERKDASVNRYIRLMQYELSQIAESQKILEQLLEDERKEAKSLSKFESTDEEFRLEIGRTQQLYDQTIKRLQEINLVRDFGGYDAKVIASASLGVQIAPSLSRILLISIALGSLGGFVLAYLAESTDHSFRSPDEIRRRLGLPILGHIPLSEEILRQNRHDRSENLEPSAALCMYHRPTSLEAEAYRGLRTAVFFASKTTNCKVIQVTSPNMGDGKTTIAANLAVAISQSGKRVALIDADFRRPRIHHILGCKSNYSIDQVIACEVTLLEGLQSSSITGLSVLTCNQRPANPAEILTLPNFDRILTELRVNYDFIIIDTPPLLAVTDPCIVAGRVDGVILTVRIAKNGRPAAERAKDMLSTMGVKVLGVVVNGAGKQSVSYGYRYYAYDEFAYEYRSDQTDNLPSDPIQLK